MSDELCHRCGERPGTERFYVVDATGTALAGVTLKFSVRRTVGCEQCWNEFVRLTGGNAAVTASNNRGEHEHDEHARCGQTDHEAEPER